jgi:hypothetical protein
MTPPFSYRALRVLLEGFAGALEAVTLAGLTLVRLQAFLLGVMHASRVVVGL